MKIVRLCTAVLLAVAVLVAPQQLQAQGAFEGGVGLAFPAGDLADTQDPGFTANLALDYPIAGPLDLRLSGDMSLLNGLDDDHPLGPTRDLDLWTYTGGFDLDIVEATRRSPFGLSWNGGAGVTVMSPSPIADTDAELDNETEFTTTTGLRTFYKIGERGALFLGGQWQILFDTDAAGQNLHNFPVVAGLNIGV